jgi:hypothetical protein
MVSSVYSWAIMAEVKLMSAGRSPDRLIMKYDAALSSHVETGTPDRRMGVARLPSASRLVAMPACADEGNMGGRVT